MVPLKADEKAGKLPGTLKESLDALEQDAFLKQVVWRTICGNLFKGKKKGMGVLYAGSYRLGT